MLLLRKGKAALLCPLLSGSELIGSLELYRFDGAQAFTPEVEARLQCFSLQLAEIANLFLSMRQTNQ